MVEFVSNDTTMDDGNHTTEPTTVKRRLPRHPLSLLSGKLTADERDHLVDDVSQSKTAVVFDVLDDHVLYDWHRYEVAVELEKRIVFNHLHHDDPTGYLISRLFGGRSLDRGQRAAVEVSLRSWQPTGHPKKTAKNTALNEGSATMMTTKDMVEEADVCQTYIQMAKRVYRKGGEAEIRRVIDGELSLNVADNMLSGRTRGERSVGVDNGPDSVAATRAATSETPTDVHADAIVPPVPSGDDALAGGDVDGEDGPTYPFWADVMLTLTRENHHLKRVNQDLEEENRLLRARVEQLSKSQPGTPHQKPGGAPGMAVESGLAAGDDAGRDAGDNARDDDGQMQLAL